jgi:(5-formylfuran-3-yl)methyl phosphate synthase
MNRPGLLVSVRNVAEARIALQGGVDLIDIKQPQRGALGACDAQTIIEIAAEIAEQVPVSVALGELRDFKTLRRPLQLTGIQFAKFGLAGMADVANWKVQLLDAWAELAELIAPVAVIYADSCQARAPARSEILNLARTSRCGAVLVDTFLKDGRNVFEHLSPAELRILSQQVRDAGKLFVLGGSLDDRTIPIAAELGIDYVAVRGAACKHSRTSEIDAGRIAKIAQVLRAPRRPRHVGKGERALTRKLPPFA